jgi:hypothetical protein
MQIALDYDKTYTADPELWEKFIGLAQARNHSVCVVTMRYPYENIKGLTVPVVYTSREAKVKHFIADVWIDDSPNWIYQDSI